MSFTLEINKYEYAKLFNPDKNDMMKNFIVEFLNDADVREKKITSCKKKLKIEKVKKILHVHYSTENETKIDVTDVILMNIKNREITRFITQVSSCFNNFIDKYISFLCGRCGGKGHHKGLTNFFLQPQNKYDIKMIENFFEDTEHGFFHGLMASFICYVINEDETLLEKKNSLEKIFISATMHDFLKTNGVPQKEHDIKLKGVYPNLCDETYVHSEPPEKYHKKHLIIADRLELRRYPDYKSWVDERFHTLYKKMKPDTKNMLDMFYTVYRPALEYVFKNRKSVFIRHATGDDNSLFSESKIEKLYFYSHENGFEHTKNNRFVYMFQELNSMVPDDYLLKLIKSDSMIISHKSYLLMFQFFRMFKQKISTLL